MLMRRFVRYAPSFLIGAFAVVVAAWSFGFLPTEIKYCYDDETNKDCPMHYAAFVALWQITKSLNWISPWITAAATALIAYFTLTLKKATDDLATISTNTANAQERDTRILQRAYISAEPGGVSPFLPRDLAAPPTNQTFVGHVGFRNAGRLPARNVRWYMDAEYSTDPNYEPVRFGELTGKNVISPGEAMTQGSFEKDIPEHLGYFFVWGKVVYDDGFGKERETIFCHRYNCRRLERNNGFFRIRGRYGRHHNKGNDAN